MAAVPLIAVDIGNARIKLGYFPGPIEGLPSPTATLPLPGRRPALDALPDWLEQLAIPPGVAWWIGSVNRPAAAWLVAWLGANRPDDPIRQLTAADLPLRVALPEPEKVGIDRLLDAVAANRLRAADRPAVVVDLGTALTVDLVSADGAFCGGAIAPGIAMSARALHEFTDLLPWIDMAELDAPPEPLGTSTVDAMRSGLFYVALGGIRELIAQMSQKSGSPADIFLSGGAGPAVAQLLGSRTRHIAHLTLGGIAITAATGASG